MDVALNYNEWFEQLHNRPNAIKPDAAAVLVVRDMMHFGISRRIVGQQNQSVLAEKLTQTLADYGLANGCKIAFIRKLEELFAAPSNSGDEKMLRDLNHPTGKVAMMGKGAMDIDDVVIAPNDVDGNPSILKPIRHVGNPYRIPSLANVASMKPA